MAPEDGDCKSVCSSESGYGYTPRSEGMNPLPTWEIIGDEDDDNSYLTTIKLPGANPAARLTQSVPLNLPSKTGDWDYSEPMVL